MKSLIKLSILNIKNNRYIVLCLIIMIYGFILPILLSNQTNKDDIIIIWFQYLQKLFILPMIIMVGYFYKPFVEKEYAEVIQSTHQKNQLIYLFFDICLIQVFMFPFYLILIFNYQQILPYILIVILQFLVLISVYQLICLLTYSTTLSLGLLLCYILLFSLVLNDMQIGNVFINGVIEYISISYYIICFVVIIICLILSYVLQKYR